MSYSQLHLQLSACTHDTHTHKSTLFRAQNAVQQCLISHNVHNIIYCAFNDVTCVHCNTKHLATLQWSTVLSPCIVGTDRPIHLGRDGSNDCVALQCSSCDPFQNDRIVASSSTTFVARIGPSGDQRGYIGITGEENPLVSSYNEWCVSDVSIMCLQVELGGVLRGSLMALSSLSWW